jgi:hypothetical protein
MDDPFGGRRGDGVMRYADSGEQHEETQDGGHQSTSPQPVQPRAVYSRSTLIPVTNATRCEITDGSMHIGHQPPVTGSPT